MLPITWFTHLWLRSTDLIGDIWNESERRRGRGDWSCFDCRHRLYLNVWTFLWLLPFAWKFCRIWLRRLCHEGLSSSSHCVRERWSYGWFAKVGKRPFMFIDSHQLITSGVFSFWILCLFPSKFLVDRFESSVHWGCFWLLMHRHIFVKNRCWGDRRGLFPLLSLAAADLNRDVARLLLFCILGD